MTSINYRFTAGEDRISVRDFQRAAKRKLPRMIWEYVEGGSEDHAAMQDNRDAFQRWALRMSALTGHEHRDLATSIAGAQLELPVLLAPTGFTGLSHWTGDVAAAKGAERLGSRYVLSTASSWSLEEVADAVSEPPFFQLYPTGSEDEVAALMDRAWAAGYRTLFVTVDVPIRGNREGERKHGMGVPPVLTPARILGGAAHPRWAYNFMRHRRIAAPNPVTGSGVKGAIAAIEAQSKNMRPTLNWRDVKWMRDRWHGAFFIKGLLDSEDAERAVELGADGIVVSNHGGRQLDSARATLDALTDIAPQVAGRIQVLMDGGVRRGTDVLKALALGADAVMIGRPYIYGLAVSGEDGVADVLRLFKEEMEVSMTLAGIRSVKDLDRRWVVPRPPAGRLA